MIKKCKICNNELNINNWYSYHIKDNYRICKVCYQKRARDNHNKEKHSKRMKKSSIELKKQTIEAYGGKCNCCGENDLLYLTIDHILNNGAQERRDIATGGQKFYRYLKKNNFFKPDEYRVLCFNCNSCIGFYGFCAHKFMNNKDRCTICCIKLHADNQHKFLSKSNISLCNYCSLQIKINITNNYSDFAISKYQIWSRTSVLNRRVNIIEQYGNVCNYCGESAAAFLTIDHIIKESKETYKSARDLYIWLKENNYPKNNYQLLCLNCNCSKGYYNNIPENKIII